MITEVTVISTVTSQLRNYMKHFYFAYGMNTNIGGMKRRCPAAISMGSAALYDYDFRFATHADVVYKQGHKTVGVLWELTDACLRSLDGLESCYFDKNGNPDPTSYYNRKIVQVLHNNKTYDAWVYYMTPGIAEAPPADSYWNCLMEGYKEHNVSRKQLHRAITSAYDAVEPVQINQNYAWSKSYRSNKRSASNSWYGESVSI
jgi:gamma-glutamylcyclotransferase (GGCT)/AIG2-like uncharacterized protein YtfP